MAASGDRTRSFWPIALAMALAGMMSASLGLLWLAVSHPDTTVTQHPLATGDTPPRAAH